MSSDSSDPKTSSEPTQRERDEDRILDEVVKDALTQCGGLLTEEERAEAASFIHFVLATHPTTVELLDQLVPAPHVDESGKVGADREAKDANSPDAEQGGGRTAGGAG
jgi:hypothetical protein